MSFVGSVGCKNGGFDSLSTGGGVSPVLFALLNDLRSNIPCGISF